MANVPRAIACAGMSASPPTSTSRAKARPRRRALAPEEVSSWRRSPRAVRGPAVPARVRQIPRPIPSCMLAPEPLAPRTLSLSRKLPMGELINLAGMSKIMIRLANILGIACAGSVRSRPFGCGESPARRCEHSVIRGRERSRREPSPFPNFWDPKRRVERPPAGAVPAIRFVTTDDFPPFNFLDADGRLTGFNVDLARAICAELDIRCTIQARRVGRLARRARDKTRRRRDRRHRDHRRQPRGARLLRRLPALRRRASSCGATRRRSISSPDGLKRQDARGRRRTAHEAYLAAFFPEVGRKLYPTRRRGARGAASRARPTHISATACS